MYDCQLARPWPGPGYAICRRRAATCAHCRREFAASSANQEYCALPACQAAKAAMWERRRKSRGSRPQNARFTRPAAPPANRGASGDTERWPKST